MVRLRTAHTRLKAHILTKLEMVPWAACQCCNEDQTKESILQNCNKGMTTKDPQLDQLKRHSIRNYMVMTRISVGQHSLSLRLACPCNSEQEEDDVAVMYIVYLKGASVKANIYHAPCHCSIDGNNKKTQLISELERCSFILFQYF